MPHPLGKVHSQAHQLTVTLACKPTRGELASTDVVSPEQGRLGTWKEEEEDQSLADSNQLGRLVGGGIDGVVDLRDRPIHGERDESRSEVSSEHDAPPRQSGASPVCEQFQGVGW